MVSTQDIDGPLDGQPDEQASQILTPLMVSNLTFSMDNGRFARASRGKAWDPQNVRVRSSAFRACFNGNANKMLLEEGLILLGNIEDADNPEGQLTVNTQLLPLWLSYSPVELLSRLGYQTTGMVHRELKEHHNGVECDVLAIPRGTSASEVLVYVDASIGYLPVRLATSYRGTPRQDISITYKPNASVGWIASKWESRYFNHDGGLERSLTGEATAVSINEPLEDSLFELQFPTGTHIVWHKEDGDEYYIQDLGKVRPISEMEYGVLPDSR